MRFSNFLVQFFSDSKKILIRELQEIREFLIWRKKEAELKILIILRQPHHVLYFEFIQNYGHSLIKLTL